MARLMIHKKTGLSNDEIEFTHNQYGKPHLKRSCDCHFNVSHSGTYAVCAIDRTEIGIDIELIKPEKVPIGKQFFSALEYNDLINREKEEQIDYFFELWTLKESYVKLLGKGLSLSFSSFTFRNFNGEISLYTPHENRSTFFQLWNNINGYKLALSRQHEHYMPLYCKSINELYIGSGF